MDDQFALGYRAALEAAAEAVPQGWCLPETSSTEMDVVLGQAIQRAILALPVPDLRETLDLDAGLDAMFSGMRQDDQDVPNWREFNATQQDTLRNILRPGILAALGVKE